MEQNFCILLPDITLTEETDSRGHILPSALGGRLKPRGLLSKKANGILNDKFDAPLTKMYSALMAVLGASRDSGENIPARLSDQAGKEYRVLLKDHLQIPKLEFFRTKTDSGTDQIQIKAPSLKAARKSLLGLKKKDPNLDVKKLLRTARHIRDYPSGPLILPIAHEPIVLFPAAFVIASIFAAYKGLKIHPSFRSYVNSFDKTKPVLPPDTFFFCPSGSWLNIPLDVEVSHVMILCLYPEGAKIIFYIELFNLPGVAVLFPYDGKSTTIESYGINILTGQPFSVGVDQLRLTGLPWSASHSIGDEDLIKLLKERATQLRKIIEDRSKQYAIDRIIGDVAGPDDGGKITVEQSIEMMLRTIELSINGFPMFRELPKEQRFDILRQIVNVAIREQPQADRPRLELRLGEIVDRMAKQLDI